MGYNVELACARFRIANENFDAVLSIMRNMGEKDEGYWYVNNKELARAQTIRDAFLAWRYRVDFDKDGICSISFDGDKLGEDDALFNAISPYVENGSFIEMHGDDGYLWRWVFHNGECKEIRPTITWDGGNE